MAERGFTRRLRAYSSVCHIKHLRIGTLFRGARSNVQDCAVIHARGSFGNATAKKGLPTIIGNDVSLGHKAMVHACVIEDRCLIGINAVVLDGAVVCSGSLIAAGAVVTPGKVVDGGLWAGTPAKKIRELSEEEQQMLIDNASNYVDLKNMWKEAMSQSS